MAKEVSVHVWCDLHMLQDSQRVPGETTPPITIGHAKPRTLDLCEACRKEVLDTLQHLLHDEGVVVDGSNPQPQLGTAPSRRSGGRSGVNATPGPFDCKVPGCPGRNSFANNGPGYPYLGALKSHLSYQHSMAFPDYVEAHGEPQPELAPVPPGPPRKSRVSANVEERDDLPDPGPDYTCGIDGCPESYPPSEYRMPKQALGLHRASVHGVRAAKRGRAG